MTETYEDRKTAYDKRRADLLAAGFREHPNNHLVSIWKYDILFQKRITDENGTRYFVEAMAYHHPDHDGWEVEVNYNDGVIFTNLAAVRIKIFGIRCDWTAADALRWADEFWTRLCPNYYERNQ